MLIKITLFILFLIAVYNLFSALPIMIKNKNEPMTQTLGKRLLFSVALVVIILIALSTGFIQPNTPF